MSAFTHLLPTMHLTCLVRFTLLLAVVISPHASDLLAIDYLADIKPVLAEKCYSCHGRIKQEAGLRLDTRALMIDGEVIEPGNPDESSLLQRIMSVDDSRMPPHEEGSALKPLEIEAILKWIVGGALAPEEATPSGPGEHWAFQEIQPPVLPRDNTSSNVIDVFLAANRKHLSLNTTDRAPRTLSIRRLYLDLIGLPPTVTQLEDDRPWETIVDELLQNPQHGERWARHWMDVWRYSDWYGLGKQLRYSQKHLWHWRDWIVESLNADKGYDRMIHEMIAGDELAPDNPDVLRATGFLARNYYLFNRTTWLDSTIEHTSKAFFGLTVNCAKCHDHKYDPITQLDYYKMRAIFEPHQVRLDPIPGVIDFERDGLPRVFDDHTDQETYLHVRGDPKNPDTETKIAAGVPGFLSTFEPPIQPVSLPRSAFAPGTREYVQQDHLASAARKVAAAEKTLNAAKEELAAAPTAKAAVPASDAGGDFLLTDDFDEPDPAVWKVIGDGWQYRDGSLHQTTATRDREMVRLVQQIPADFEATCVYTTTGGSTYKSVTFRFDQSEDLKYSSYVYTSAHAPGPKVQVAFTRGGKTDYPAQGRKAHKIEVGRKYTLRFAVRGTLVNVWLDDQFMLAYRLPDRRPQGFLSLSGFDATVAFDSITIRALGPEVALQEAGNKTVATASDLKSAVKQASVKLTAAIAHLDSIQATVDAENAKHRDRLAAQAVRQYAAIAATKQAQWELAEAQYQALADPSKSKAATKMKKQAKARLAAIEKGDVAYQPIRGAKKALESPADEEEDYPANYTPISTGRRLALARWATDARNPLTARVAVNHVWMRHFGQPLVESVFDFGLRAPKPIHAELLDFLAYDFMQSGWSFKHLHRMIVMSDAYQRSSQATKNDHERERDVDAQNEYYWRGNTRRMESQVVRDSLLHLAGTLDTTMGGPSDAVNASSRRRSLYFKHSRDEQDRFLKMFDDADLLQCYRRSESVVPQQALALANSKLAISAASQIAARIVPGGDGDKGFIQAAFRLLLAREATDAELAECHFFFRKMRELLSDRAHDDINKKSRARMIHALINHNDFVSIR